MHYWSGFATGVSAVLLCFFGGIAFYLMPAQIEMYEEFKGATLPQLTSLVISPVWYLSVPTIAIATVLALNVAKFKSEVRRAIGLAVVASVVLFAVVFTYWAMVLPIFSLAGNISAN